MDANKHKIKYEAITGLTQGDIVMPFTNSYLSNAVNKRFHELNPLVKNRLRSLVYSANNLFVLETSILGALNRTSFRDGIFALSPSSFVYIVEDDKTEKGKLACRVNAENIEIVMNEFNRVLFEIESVLWNSRALLDSITRVINHNLSNGGNKSHSYNKLFKSLQQSSKENKKASLILNLNEIDDIKWMNKENFLILGKNNISLRDYITHESSLMNLQDKYLAVHFESDSFLILDMSLHQNDYREEVYLFNSTSRLIKSVILFCIMVSDILNSEKTKIQPNKAKVLIAEKIVQISDYTELVNKDEFTRISTIRSPQKIDGQKWSIGVQSLNVDPSIRQRYQLFKLPLKT